MAEAKLARAQSEDTDPFVAAVEKAEQRRQSMVLQIWSSKREELRGMLRLIFSFAIELTRATADVRITPSQSWSVSTKAVTTHADAQPSLLGLSLRLCSPEGALEQVWHILDILEGSPAQSAGQSSCVLLIVSALMY